MSYLDVASGSVVSELPGEQKAAFIRRTYGHLAVSIAVFALLEAQLLKMGFGEQMMALLAASKWSWLLVLGAFMLVGVVADKWARSDHSREMQYAGLGIYIVAEAIIFLPLIYMALRYAPDVLPNAALITASLVTGLTYVVFTTRRRLFISCTDTFDWFYYRNGADHCLDCFWFSIRYRLFWCHDCLCCRQYFVYYIEYITCLSRRPTCSSIASIVCFSCTVVLVCSAIFNAHGR